MNSLSRRFMIFSLAMSYMIFACSYQCLSLEIDERDAIGISEDQVDTYEPYIEIEEKVEEIESSEEKKQYFDVPLDEDLQDYIFIRCEEKGLDPAIVISLISKESNFNPNAVGDKGNSLGLMQIQPRWHKDRMERLGCTDLMDPYQNVTVGIDLLGDLVAFKNSVEWGLMAYNGGCTYANRKASQGVVSDYAKTIISMSKECAMR